MATNNRIQPTNSPTFGITRLDLSSSTPHPIGTQTIGNLQYKQAVMILHQIMVQQMIFDLGTNSPATFFTPSADLPVSKSLRPFITRNSTK